jgi:hypothetical protein
MEQRFGIVRDVVKAACCRALHQLNQCWRVKSLRLPRSDEGGLHGLNDRLPACSDHCNGGFPAFDIIVIHQQLVKFPAQLKSSVWIL